MSKINSFQIKYILFIYITLVFGGIHLFGPITGRHIMLFYMFLVCLKETKALWNNWIFSNYIVFIGIFGLGSILYGYGNLFAHDLFAYYVPSYIACWATYILITKYQSLDTLLFSLVTLGILNGVITVGQYFNNPIAFAVPAFLEVTGYEKIPNLMISSISNDTNNYALYGIFGAVGNGYFASVAAVLSLNYIGKWKNTLVLILWIFLMFSLFCVQQRSALAAGVLGSFLLFFKKLESITNVQKIGLVTGLIAVLYVMLSRVNYEAMFSESRYTDYSLGSRADIYKHSEQYIIENLFTANYYHYDAIYNIPPHNLFYNMVVYGTIIGAIPLLIILISLSKTALKLVIMRIKPLTSTYVCVAMAFFVYNISSLAHNASIVTGDVLFWLLAIPLMYESTAIFIDNNYETNPINN